MKENIENIKVNNNILSENKPRKRRYSVPLKTFRITSPSESKILSIVCDSIFEDVNVEQNNNPSMIILESKINLRNISENKKNNNDDENIINNINKINIGDEKNLNNISNNNNRNEKNINILEDDDNDDNLEGVQVHKKSYIFNNILKIKMMKCPRLLEEQWKYEKILLDYNIIDFTSKN